MKLAALTLIALIGPAAAEEQQQDTCLQISGLAGVIMQARQSGTEASTLINASKGSAVFDFAKTLVIDAYNKPQYSTESNRLDAVSDFKNQVYIECLKIQA